MKIDLVSRARRFDSRSTNMEKSYKNEHPYTLVHRYTDGALVTREWRADPRVENYSYVGPDTDGKIVQNTKSTRPPELKHSVIKTDGSEKLEDLVEDIYRSFCFTGACHDYNGHDEELHRAIYESKLPSGTKLYRYDTGTVCQGVVEMLETSEKVGEPKSYYELFEIIGIPCEYDEVQTVGDYTIWQYPDSVVLQLKAEDGKLFFGYCR